MNSEKPTQRVSLVIPVYRGEHTLPALLQELELLTHLTRSPAGNHFAICEVLLVHDCGPDRSDTTIEALAALYPFVRPVWLSKNFGQHPATLAGMASATGDWVVTIDEDGQQDPADLAKMLDIAIEQSLQLVYAKPVNPPPHGWLRNLLSRGAKSTAARLIGSQEFRNFNSYRLIDGEVARILAAYCGNGVYLDIALFWVAGRIGHCPARLRAEICRGPVHISGYSYIKLLLHFWRLLLTSGTGPLRLITVAGFAAMSAALGLAGYALYAKLTQDVPVQGWTSLFIAVAFFGGSILTALGVIAEYLAAALGIAMGKPLYVVATKPTRVRLR